MKKLVIIISTSGVVVLAGVLYLLFFRVGPPLPPDFVFTGRIVEVLSRQGEIQPGLGEVQSEQELGDVDIFFDEAIVQTDKPIGKTNSRGRFNIGVFMRSPDKKEEAESIGNGVYGGQVGDGSYVVFAENLKGYYKTKLKFVKKPYADETKKVLIPPLSINVKMTRIGKLVIIKAQKTEQEPDSSSDYESSPIPGMKFMYSTDLEYWRPTKNATNVDGELELIIPDEVEEVGIKPSYDKEAGLILQETEKTVPVPNLITKVDFVFKAAATRWIQVTCIDSNNQGIPGVEINAADKNTALANDSGVASLEILEFSGAKVGLKAVHPDYFTENIDITIEAGRQGYDETMVLFPKNFVAVSVTVDTPNRSGEPAIGVDVLANKQIIGRTNSEGQITAKLVRNFSADSSVTVGDSRYQLNPDGVQIHQLTTSIPYKYEVTINLLFKALDVTITTIAAETGKPLRIGSAELIDVNMIVSSPSQVVVLPGEVKVRVSSPNQKIKLSKFGYIPQTIELSNRTVRMRKASIKIIARITNENDGVLPTADVKVKIGNDAAISPAAIEAKGAAYPEGTYDIAVTSDERDDNGRRKYANWYSYGHRIMLGEDPGENNGYLLRVALMSNYLGRAKRAESVADFATAITEYSNYIETGERLSKGGQFNIVSSDYFDTLIKLGKLLGRQGSRGGSGRPDGAIEIFGKAIKIRGDNAEAYYYLGLYSYLNGGHEKARTSFKRVIANELNAGDDMVKRTYGYLAKTLYSLSKQDPSNEKKHKNNATNYCEDFKRAVPVLVQDRDSDLAYIQDDIRSIYESLTGESLY